MSPYLPELEEYAASLFTVLADMMVVSHHTPIYTDSDDSGSSSDEVKIIQELKAAPNVHNCTLCVQGTSLVKKMLRYSGLDYKYACELCLLSFRTKPLALKHARKHKRVSDESPVINVKTGVTVDESMAVNEGGMNASYAVATESFTDESDSFICHICELHCKSEKGLKRHNTNKHGLTHSCPTCGTHFKVFREFQRHCNKHACSPSSTVTLTDGGPPKLLSCPACQKNFLFRKSFEDHVCRLMV